jgi:hypothetical protein
MRRWLWLLALGGGAAIVAACSSSSSAPPPGPAPTGKDQATVDQGKASVVSRDCVKCHGQNMAGALTPIAYPQDPNVELFPPNLTPDPTYGITSWTDDQLALAIRTGVDETGLELCPQMKHFSAMNDYETYSIVKYLRSIPPVNQRVLRSVCPPLKTKEEQEAGVP